MSLLALPDNNISLSQSTLMKYIKVQDADCQSRIRVQHHEYEKKIATLVAEKEKQRNEINMLKWQLEEYEHHLEEQEDKREQVRRRARLQREARKRARLEEDEEDEEEKDTEDKGEEEKSAEGGSAASAGIDEMLGW